MAAAPPPANAYAYTKYGTYRLAYLVSYVALRLGISANALTWLDLAVSMTAVVMLVSSGPVVSPAVAAAAWALLTFGYVLDSADGQVARASSTVSPLGEWLDHVLDVAKHVAVNLAYGWVLIGSGTRIPAAADYLLISASLLSMEVAFFSSMLREKLEKAAGRGRSCPPRSAVDRLLRAPTHLCDYGIFVCFALLLPWLDTFRAAFTVYVALCAISRCGSAIWAAMSLRTIRTASGGQRNMPGRL